jgi:hypothetical protein
MNSDIFEDHVQKRALGLSIFTYLESTHFFENFEISYIIVGIVQAKEPVMQLRQKGKSQSCCAPMTHIECSFSENYTWHASLVHNVIGC